jgi:hypothetical protein
MVQAVAETGWGRTTRVRSCVTGAIREVGTLGGSCLTAAATGQVGLAGVIFLRIGGTYRADRQWAIAHGEGALAIEGMVVVPTPGFTLHLAVGAALSRRTVANGILVKGGARFIAATLPLLFLRRADAADSADSSDRAES